MFKRPSLLYSSSSGTFTASTTVNAVGGSFYFRSQAVRSRLFTCLCNNNIPTDSEIHQFIYSEFRNYRLRLEWPLGSPWVGPINAVRKRLKLATVTPGATSTLSASSASLYFCRCWLDAFSSSLTHAAINLQPPSCTILEKNTIRKERTYDVLFIRRESGNGTKKYSEQATSPHKQKKVVCVCNYKIAHNHAIRPCQPSFYSHSMPLALVLLILIPRGDQWYLLRKRFDQTRQRGHSLLVD